VKNENVKPLVQKIIKNFKLGTAEHETKHESLLR
jgi:hypothetical protein